MSNPLEPIDIVNENGDILYKTTKKEAHEKGLLHKTVIGEVINSNGQIYLVKQADDRQDPGQFVSPVGGHVTSGESEEEALKREAQEELGITISNYKLVGRKTFNREVIGRKENHLFCVYEIYTDDPFILNHESVAYKAFSPEELKKTIKENPKMIGDASHFVLQSFYPQYYE